MREQNENDPRTHYYGPFQPKEPRPSGKSCRLKNMRAQIWSQLFNYVFFLHSSGIGSIKMDPEVNINMALHFNLATK